MTIHDLHVELESIGIPVKYRANDGYTSPPFLIYLLTGNDDVMADDMNYHAINEFDIELYTRAKDTATEALVEAKLKELHLPYQKFEAWIETEKVYQIAYEIAIVE